jgi:predicted NBD/HSP70 family sugar kinase
MNDSQWAFGLSLDEKIEWCLNKVRREGTRWVLSNEKDDKIYGEIEVSTQNLYIHGLHDILREHLTMIANSIPNHVIECVTSIGVSIVGLADRDKLQLTSIARKNWGKPNAIPVVDFKALFNGVFPNVNVNPSSGRPLINIHNESTAKCLAEWSAMAEGDKVSSLFYVMFSEGVNAGFVAHGQALYTELHTELGHIWPRPHRKDVMFNPAHSGCRIHKYCFEGLASAKRIRDTWADSKDVHLSKLSDEAKDVISFYVAQMCMNGVLAVSPERILLGGSTLYPGILRDINGYFRYFNDGGTGERYLNYKAMRAKGFIRMASISANDAGVAAALELARRVIQEPGAALRVSSAHVPRQAYGN